MRRKHKRHTKNEMGSKVVKWLGLLVSTSEQEVLIERFIFVWPVFFRAYPMPSEVMVLTRALPISPLMAGQMQARPRRNGTALNQM